MLIEKQKSPTIRDVAREAGVSTMTVTRAFRENALITEKTRERVVEAARKLKFIPDQNAKILRGGSSMSIGILITNPCINEVVRNLSAILMKEKYVSFIADSLGDIQIVKSALADFCSRKVGGAVLQWRNYYSDVKEIIELLNQLHNVVLYTDNGAMIQGFDSCALDYQPAYLDAVKKLFAAGKRKIVYLGRHEQSQARACLDAIKFCEMTVENCLWETSAYASKPAFANYRDALHDRILAGEIPDAIFTFNDIAAAQASTCLREHNLRVPEDVAVIGNGNEPFSALYSPPLATFDKMSIPVSEKIYFMLMTRISQPDTGVQREKINCKYIPRQSAGIQMQKGYKV